MRVEALRQGAPSPTSHGKKWEVDASVPPAPLRAGAEMTRGSVASALQWADLPPLTCTDATPTGLGTRSAGPRTPISPALGGSQGANNPHRGRYGALRGPLTSRLVGNARSFQNPPAPWEDVGV